MNLFKDIKITHDSWSGNCGWYFAYRDNKYGHEYSKTTSEIQIKVIEDMLNTMKKLKKNEDDFIKFKENKEQMKEEDILKELKEIKDLLEKQNIPYPIPYYPPYPYGRWYPSYPYEPYYPTYPIITWHYTC